MRLVLFCLIICNFAFGSPTNKCVGVSEFSDRQKEIIAYAYNYGKKYDLGYTLAAIAWHESCAGEYRMNFADPSAGIYHALIPGVIKRYKMLKDTGFNRNVIGDLLVRDDEFASKVAIDELLYWKKVRNNNLKDMIKSYNKGFSWEKSNVANVSAENYYDNINAKSKILQIYLSKNLANIKIKEREPMLSNFALNNNATLSDKKQEASKAEVLKNIRKVEIATFKKYDKTSIKQALENKKAVISVYNIDGDKFIHEKTLTLKPFYVSEKSE